MNELSGQKRLAILLLIVAGGLLVVRGRGCSLPSIGGKPTAATYFYDDQKNAAPPGVLVAISKLNSAGIMATQHEVDTTDASGDVPEQYKVSLPAAKEAGLPALVVMGGERVLAVVKDPKTEQEVLTAVGL